MDVSKDLKILLVEDAGVMRKMEVKTLKTLGIENIIEAENGEDAISKLELGVNPDLIISDWNMPVKDGFELLKWVREGEEYKKIPFLMATGRGEKKEVSMAKDAGVNAFISKPFNADELKEKILEAIGEIKEEDPSKVQRVAPVITDSGKVKLRIAHIQITDHLVLGVLKDLIRSGKLRPEHFELETVAMGGWNPVAKALENGSVDGACVLAPIAMDLYSHKVPIKLVLFAHKNGSIFVRNRKGGNFETERASFYRDKSFYLPHMMSIHNMLAHMFFKGIGLEAGVPGNHKVDVSLEVVPPVQMPQIVAQSEEAAGYFVAEPLGTKAIAAGNADLQFLSSELYEDHPCCVVTVQDDVIDKYRVAVEELSKMLVHAGKFIETNPGTAAEIAVKFLDPNGNLGLKVPLLKNVLTEPKGITTGDLYPDIEALDKIQHYMHNEMGIGNIIDVNEFVDISFANAACTNVSERKKAVLHNNPDRLNEILKKSIANKSDTAAKELLNKEGKYLIFTLDKQKYCMDILKIREIIRMVPVRSYPQSPEYVLGVINLRGSIVPVMDSRIIFNLPKINYDTKHFIIVLETEVDGKEIKMGIAVDGVSEVANVVADQIHNPPAFVVNEGSNYVMAIAKVDGKLNMIVDIDKLLYINQTDTPIQAQLELSEAV